MKVTPFRLRFMAVWMVVKTLPTILQLHYLEYYNMMMEGYVRNPKIKW